MRACTDRFYDLRQSIYLKVLITLKTHNFPHYYDAENWLLANGLRE